MTSDEVNETAAPEEVVSQPTIASYLVRIVEREVRPVPTPDDYATPKARTNQEIEAIIETALGGPYVNISASSERLDR